MNLAFTEREQAFRAECRAWLQTHVPGDLGSSYSRDGVAAHVAWEKTLFDAGWAVVSWPHELGGRDATLIEWLIFEEEYYRAGAPLRITQNGIFLLAPSLFAHGTEAQRARILRRMASAEELWAQAWSEPGAGSDLAAVRSTARKVDGGWLLSGQKTWSTRASFCDRAYGPFRTDPDSTRYRGLTYFLFPLHADGVTVRGIARLDGDEAFSEIFLDDVFVPDEDVLGAVGDGWKVAMSTTSSERGLSLRSPGRFMAAADRLLALWKQSRDPRLADRVVRCWTRTRAYRLYTFATATRMMRGEPIGSDSSLNKLFWSELDVELHALALELLGEGGQRADTRWMKDFLFSLAGPIYAGTNEIQRNIVARRVLDLPRS